MSFLDSPAAAGWIAGVVGGILAPLVNQLLSWFTESHKVRLATAAKRREIRFTTYYDKQAKAMEVVSRRLREFLNAVRALTYPHRDDGEKVIRR